MEPHGPPPGQLVQIQQLNNGRTSQGYKWSDIQQLNNGRASQQWSDIQQLKHVTNKKRQAGAMAAAEDTHFHQ